MSPLRGIHGAALLSLCLLLMNTRALAAADEPISTDRPDFVESSDVVAAQVVQVEIGASLVHDSQSRGYAETFTVPTLLRVGVGHSLELRLETDQRTIEYDRAEGRHITTHGYSDIAVGVKLGLRQAEGLGSGPGIAALVHADIDTGSAEFRGKGIRPSFRMVAEWELPNDMSIGVMPGLVYDNNENGRFVNGIFAVTTGKQWTARMRTFLEVAAEQLAAESDGGCLVTYDTGATYLLTNDIQVDLAISRGANDDTPEWGFGAGVSVRF